MIPLPRISHVIGRAGRFSVDRLHRSGTDPSKVLVIADGALLGPADGDSDRYLPAAVADRLAMGVPGGIDVDVVTDLTPALRAVRGAFAGWRLWRYDVVLVVVDERTTTGRAALRRHLPRLLEEVLADIESHAHVVVVALQPPEGERRMAATTGSMPPPALLELLTRAADRLRWAPMTVAGDAGESLPQVPAWGGEIARVLTEAMERGRRGRSTRRSQRDDDDARVRALAALGLPAAPSDPRLDHVVDLARQAFGTACAELNFIGRDRMWKLAVSGGADAGSMERAAAFCDFTIRQARPTIIPDARHDPRTAGMPGLARTIGFYAGYPVESLEGYRIGSLCVYDPEPRRVDDLDVALLRDLALLAEAEIITGDRERDRGTPSAS